MKKQKVFIDCGAFCGETTRMGTKQYPECEKYIAIEPHPTHVKFLKYRFAYEPKIEIIQKAITTKKGTEILHENMDREATSTKTKNNKTQPIEVKTTTIKEILKPYKKHEIILKIDTEGNEYEIIQQMIKQNLLKNVKELYVDWHKQGTEKHKQTIKQLKKQGYTGNGTLEDEYYLNHIIKMIPKKNLINLIIKNKVKKT